MRTRTHTFTYTADTYSSDTKITYNALIDPNDSLNEATRYNNTGSTSTTVKAAKTDLVPSIKGYAMRNGSKVYTDTFEPGERVYAELITTNTYAPTAYNFKNYWSVTKNDTATGITEGHIATVSSLAGNDSHTVVKDFTPPSSASSYTVRIGYHVDYADAVPEYNNTVTQNTISHHITIKGLPDLVPQMIIEKGAYEAGETVKIDFYVKNIGQSTASAFNSVAKVEIVNDSAADVGNPDPIPKIRTLRRYFGHQTT